MNQAAIPPLARIDGQAINLATLEETVEAALDRAANGQGFRLFTLNLDHLVKRREDPAFRSAYARAELVTADGAPVAALARRQSPGITRTTGADLVHPLCREAALRGVPVALFGSSRETLTRTADILCRDYPTLRITHIEAPPYGFVPTSDAAAAAADRIAASGARLVFVALGAPKQELFAAAMVDRTPELGFVCIGAALDFIAGTQVRAPILFQKTGMEWLWRLASNPSRMMYRYAACALVLASLVLGGKATI